jgi:hypothetical protein
VFNDYYVNVTNDLSEDETIDLTGPLDNIEQVYANHPSIIAIKDNVKTSAHTNFNFQTITSNILYKKLCCLKSNKACGFDG